MPAETTAKNDADGMVTFGGIEYDQDDIGKTYLYTLSEEAGTLNGVEYTNQTFDISVTVSDAGNGNLNLAVEMLGKPAFETPVFENSFSQGTISVEGTKTWVDGNNENETRPDPDGDQNYNEHLTLTLQRTTAENPAEADWEEVTPGTGQSLSWSDDRYTFSGMEEFDEEGNAYTYRVLEAPVAGYDTAYDAAHLNITNTANTISVRAAKTWLDGNGDALAEARLPEKLEITLYRNGTTEYRTATLNRENGWSYEFTELPTHDASGQPYEYTVGEETLSGFAPASEGPVAAEKDPETGIYTASLVNTVTDEVGAYQPALEITKTLTNADEMLDDVFLIGSTIRYSIHIRNNGNVTLTNVRVVDTMTANEGSPAGSVEILPGEGYQVDGTVITVDQLAPGEERNVPVEYVAQEADGGKTLTNGVIGTAASPDPENPSVNGGGTADPAPIEEGPSEGYLYAGTITVNKSVTKNGEACNVNDTIYVALFNENGEMISGMKPQAIVLANASKGSTTFVDLPVQDATYKVVEVDESGTPVAAGRNGFPYSKVLYSGETITLTEQNTRGEAVIENQIAREGNSTETVTTIVKERTQTLENTETKNDTAAEKDTATTTAKSVKTGDDTKLVVYFILILLAIIAASGALLYRKKRRDKRRDKER